jgi:hypothetical protein
MIQHPPEWSVLVDYWANDPALEEQQPAVPEFT